MNESSSARGARPPAAGRRAHIAPHPRREHYPDLSPFRRPDDDEPEGFDAAEYDREAWSDRRLEQLNLDLFDDDGRPLSRNGGEP